MPPLGWKSCPRDPIPEPSVVDGELRPSAQKQKDGCKLGVGKENTVQQPAYWVGPGSSSSQDWALAPRVTQFESIAIWEQLASAGLGVLTLGPHPRGLTKRFSFILISPFTPDRAGVLAHSAMTLISLP